MLQIKDNFQGYLATVPNKAPGIILLQEIFGVNQAMRSIADRFAADGFTVLVPDLFWHIEPGLHLGYESAD